MGKAHQEYSFELMPAPEKTRNGMYDLIIDEFIKTVLDNRDATSTSAKITIPGRNIKTMQVGLSKAAGQSGRGKEIMVSIRNGEVYLIKK